jgi:uncharacterized protein with ATP-grasp and redox domains
MNNHEKPPMFEGGTCRDYLFELAETASRLAGRDERERREAETAARKVIDLSAPGMISPILANRMLAEIARITGNADPYSDFKIEEMNGARKAFEEIKSDFKNDLRSAISVAAMGNSLDFFRPADEVLNNTKQALKSFQFFHDDIDVLEEHINQGLNLVLFLTDNSGEIYFDQILYKFLAERVERVVLVVKGRPAMNDLTRADLEQSGVADQFTEVADTGGGAGVDWDEVSPEFMALVSEADLLVCKGLANFLTVFQYPLPCPAFFIYKAKCRPVRMVLDSPADMFWAVWQDKTT